MLGPRTRRRRAVRRALVRRHARALLPARPAARGRVHGPPQTWAEWRDAHARSVKRGSRRAARRAPAAERARCSRCLRAAAGRAAAARRGPRGNFRDPRFRRALGFYVELSSDGLAPALAQQQIANLCDEFARGSFASTSAAPGTSASSSAACPRVARRPGRRRRCRALTAPGVVDSRAARASSCSQVARSRTRRGSSSSSSPRPARQRRSTR